MGYILWCSLLLFPDIFGKVLDTYAKLGRFAITIGVFHIPRSLGNVGDMLAFR